MSRYARQMVLSEVGPVGQKLLSDAHVLVVGAGGLGCPVLQYLAGAGIGTITLYDPDLVEESNLHRQPLYRMADLGQPKATAAREHLRASNPDLSVHPVIAALDPVNAQQAVSAADLVIDAADSFAVSYTLSDICLRAQVPLVSASVLGQSGYVGGFCGGVPSLRAVFPDPADNGASCATDGVFGPVVGMIGAMQAQIALQILLRLAPSPLGQLINVDMATGNFGHFSFLGAKEPKQVIPFLSLRALTPSDRIIELRSFDEAPVSVRDDAERLSPSAIRALQPSTRRLVLCCRSGLRAWRSAVELAAAGHQNVGIIAAGDQV